MGAFAVLCVFAVARLPLWGEKRGFKGVLWARGVCLGVFGALRGFKGRFEGEGEGVYPGVSF